MFKEKKIRDKAFRKWLSTLPCMKCKIEGYSQAAHFEKGGMGYKGGDDSCRPLCCARPHVDGCHIELDQNKDDFWLEGREAALSMPVYSLWKQGRLDEAASMMEAF